MLTWRRDNVLLPNAEATAEEFPCLQNISAGFLFSGVIRPLEPAPPEYVTLSMPRIIAATCRWNRCKNTCRVRN